MFTSTKGDIICKIMCIFILLMYRKPTNNEVCRQPNLNTQEHDTRICLPFADTSLP